MFQSPKVGDTPRSHGNSLHKTFNETPNGIPRSFLQPKITSTPLVRRESVFATPPKPHIMSPRRYSLSEIATPPRTNKKDHSKLYTAGPLLASTRYNLNVSTYEDTKSPGLASRIVQYNEETQKETERQRPPTHQAKYGSPGLFPVVHLFKKKLPTLEQKPRTVTIRIASPEYSRHHSQEYNRKLLEGIVKPNSPSSNRHMFASSSGEGHNSSTRSVLEALKEISRKRIHASEEYELNEDSGKRLRTENLNETDSNKRLRDDSPLHDSSSSPTKSSSKRICMYDEYAASCSSMNFSIKKPEQPGPKKTISISTLTENRKEPEQAKLINAETQTIPSEDDDHLLTSKATPEKESETTTSKTDDDKEIKKKESPVQIFDDAPLERIRKNRLAALMGSLAGKDAVLNPKPDYISTLNSNSVDTPDVSIMEEVSKAVEKPLISILSSPKKDSPQRSNKHVHFSIPESSSQPNLTTSSFTSFTLTRSSASITSPISSIYETKSPLSNKKEDNLETPAPPSSPVSLTPSSSEITMTLPVHSFGSNSSSATSVVSKESSTSLLGTSMSKSDMVISNFPFKYQTTSSMALGVKTSSMTFPTSTSASQIGFGSSVTTLPSTLGSPPKMGGFKFDLNKPTAVSAPITTISNTGALSSTTSSLPTFSFGAPAQTDANKSNPLFGNVGVIPSSTTTQSALGSTSGGFSFGDKSTTPAFPTIRATSTSGFQYGNAFAATATSSSLSTSTSNISMTPTYKFGAANTGNKPASTFGHPNTGGLNFGSTNVSSSTLPPFGTSMSVAPSVPATSAPSFGTSKAPVFSFGAPTTTSSSFGAVTTSAVVPFGTPLTTTASSGFGAPSGGFGIANTSQPSNSFGVTTTSTTLGFGTPTTSSGSFGTSSTAPMFGSNKPVSPFGVVATSIPAPFGATPSNMLPFGKGTTTFGQTTAQTSFGTPTTTVSFGAANAFDGTATTSSSVFGASNNPSSGFGKPPGSGSIFGGAPNTQAPGFGPTSSKPVFGGGNALPSTGAPALPFGNAAPATIVPAFGSTTAPAFNFGAKTTTSSTFGGSFGTTTTASTGFGSSTAPAFGTSNSFGSGSSSFGTGNTFGGAPAPAFGAVATTSQPAAFGTSNTAPAFGAQSTGFGANSNKGSMFGGSTTPSFGATTTPSFGTSTTPSFGVTTSPSFGAAPTSSFNSAAPTTGFGTPNTTPGFGGNSAASAFAKPQTGFGPGSSNTFGTSTSFGNNQQPAAGFGTSNPPNTNTAVFSFGATTAPTPGGVFSFGAAPSSSEPPKPAFNFTGGSSAPAFGNSGGSSAPAFGNSGTSSFGSAGTSSFGAPGVPQFNSPQPPAAGMFSIGSGSTSGRTRTQLRAKRRT